MSFRALTRSLPLSVVSLATIASAVISPAAAQSAIDINGFQAAWGSSNPAYDLNGDGIVNSADLSIFLGQTGGVASSGGLEGSSAPAAPSSGSNPLSQATVTPSSARISLVRPGPGFAATTPEPAAYGPAADGTREERAIARWTDVPCQVRGGRVEVAVTAYHINGIDRVEFSMNGGPWISVSTPSHSPVAMLPCYRVLADMPALGAGALAEFRAVVYPKASGQPVVLQNATSASGDPNAAGSLDGLHSHFLYNPPATPAREVFVAASGTNTNPGTAEQPVATIARALEILRTSGQSDGGCVTIREAGTYGAPASTPVTVNNTRWTTVRRDPALAPASVRIVSTAADGSLTGRNLVRTRFKRLKWEGLDFDMSQLKQMYGDPGQFVWIDRSRLFDPQGAAANFAGGGTLPIRPANLMGGVFVTDCLLEDLVYGFASTTMVRGSHVARVLGDAYTNSRCVLSCTLSDFVGQSTAIHSDVFQYWGVHRNNIVARFRAWNVNGAQNFLFDKYSGSSFTDCAFVDIAIENTQASPNTPKSQMANRLKNVLFAHVSAPGQYWAMRDDFAAPDAFVADDVVFKNCVLSWLSRGTPGTMQLPAGVTVSHSHFCVPSGTPTGPGAVALSSGSLALDVGMQSWQQTGTSAAATVGTGVAIPGLGTSGAVSRSPLPGGIEYPSSSPIAQAMNSRDIAP